jgi:anaerobic magnesium-protoporphyrin IX monomethyl ester cyclase
MASIDLVFPPLTGVNYPYLSTPSLLAYVRSHSTHTARQHDLNIAVVNWLLKPETVGLWVEEARRIVERLKDKHLDGRDTIRYARAAALALRGEALQNALPVALEAVRSREALGDPQGIAMADRIIAEALDAACVGYAPQHLNLTEPIWYYSAGSAAELKAGVEDPHNLIYRLYDQALGDLALDSDVVGISIVYHGQVLPGLCLAAWIRQRRPAIRILVGGPFFTVHRERISGEAWIFDWIDAISVFEGETALVGYLDVVDGVRSIESVPGLVWRHEAIVRNSGTAVPVDVNALPCPDFDGLPLDTYHLPARTLPLLASRGCYWRCAFCTHHYIYGDTYRVRNAAMLSADLKQLRDRWNCHHVYFVDESLSPRLLRHISSALAEDTDMRWGCELRAERSLSRDDLDAAFRSGCRVFSFGVESTSQRVLDSMGKGIRVEDIERVFHDVHAAGIHIHFMGIVGFPGETVAESDETFDFVGRHAELIDLVGFSYFYLLRHSPVDRTPESYFVEDVRDLRDDLVFEERRRYRTSRGLSMPESFDRWLEFASRPAFLAVAEKHGHRERDRFLFSDGTQENRGLQRASKAGPNEHIAVELVCASHDIAEASKRAERFLLEAGRSYNLDGNTLRESWQALGAPELLPSRRPVFYAFSPATWTAFKLDDQAAYLLVQLHNRDRDDVLADVDGAEKTAAANHIAMLSAEGLIPSH